MHTIHTTTHNVLMLCISRSTTTASTHQDMNQEKLAYLWHLLDGVLDSFAAAR